MTEDKSVGSEGFEEKAANVLNVVMVVAIGIALGLLGVWEIWRFVTGSGQPGVTIKHDWLNLLWGINFIAGGLQLAWFGRRRNRPK
ncbi:hypothetical protein BH10PSE2_BH10PSE2_24260 [soil metagenome]